MHIKLMVEVRTEDNYYVYGEDKDSKGCFGCRGGYRGGWLFRGLGPMINWVRSRGEINWVPPRER